MRSITTAFLLCLLTLPLIAQPHPSHATLPDLSRREVDLVPSFVFNGRRVFVVSTESGGPPILLLHELPGMTPQCFYLARLLAARGYTIYMPLLVGSPGKTSTNLNAAKVLFGGGFYGSRDETSPIITSLRALRDEIHSRHPSQKLGVIGMCMSGNLPPAFLDRAYVKAVVMSQPALPTFGNGKESKLALSQSDIKAARNSGVPMLAFRFTTDSISPEPRRVKFIETFGGQLTFRALPVDHTAHAVLTTELFDAPNHAKTTGPSAEALKELIGYLGAQLAP
jgi:dienelactone hydrolase